MKAGSQVLARPSQSLSQRSPAQRQPQAAAEPFSTVDSLIHIDVVAVGVGLRFLELEASAQVQCRLQP